MSSKQKDTANYLEINKASWNKRTATHVESDFYDNESFINGKNSLNEIELALLGDIKGKTVLHLQCHFGQDTISLSRLGAKAVGADISDKAIEVASELATKEGADAKFICSDIYDLPNHLEEQFDIVFTSYGTIGWLPDLQKWASVVAHFLKPNGRFIMADFHPVVWMYDYDFNNVAFKYSKSDPIIESIEGTYAQTDANIQLKTVSWNHGLGELLTSLITNGITIQQFQEFDYSPYACFNGLTEFEKGKYRVEKLGDKIPMVYAIEGVKK